MARVVVTSLGYRGDVFGYVPIADELATRGHDVTYVVPTELHPVLAGRGFKCTSPGFEIGPSVMEEHAHLVRHLGGMLMMRHLFARLIGPHLDELFEAVDAEAANADAVLSHPLTSVVASASCKRRGVPLVVGDLFPMHVPSRHTPPQGAPDLGPRVNGVLWSAAGTAMPRVMPGGRAIRAQRRRLGLPALGWSMLEPGADLTLGLASPAYVQPQPDWPASYRLVGFVPWSGSTEGGLPQDVEQFLEDGPPPIIVTQGTAAATARVDFFAAAAAAVERASGRALILASTEATAARVRASLPDRHGVLAFVPLQLLLSRCRGVVHAGGLGTCALTVSAGVPSAISPAFNDAYWHADRHENLGIGIRIRMRNLSAAVERLASDQDLHTRARDLADQVAHEDGARTAADEIEELLGTR